MASDVSGTESLDTTFSNMTCGFCILAQNVSFFFNARQTALREPCFAYAGKSNPFHAAVTFGLLGPIVLLPQ